MATSWSELFWDSWLMMSVSIEWHTELSKNMASIYHFNFLFHSNHLEQCLLDFSLLFQDSLQPTTSVPFLLLFSLHKWAFPYISLWNHIHFLMVKNLTFYSEAFSPFFFCMNLFSSFFFFLNEVITFYMVLLICGHGIFPHLNYKSSDSKCVLLIFAHIDVNYYISRILIDI